MKRPRKPKWHEQNRISAAGIRQPEQWLVTGRNQEFMTIWNKKTGAVREIALDGKQKPETLPDPSEGLARGLRERRRQGWQ